MPVSVDTYEENQPFLEHNIKRERKMTQKAEGTAAGCSIHGRTCRTGEAATLPDPRGETGRTPKTAHVGTFSPVTHQSSLLSTLGSDMSLAGPDKFFHGSQQYRPLHVPGYVFLISLCSLSVRGHCPSFPPFQPLGWQTWPSQGKSKVGMQLLC